MNLQEAKRIANIRFDWEAHTSESRAAEQTLKSRFGNEKEKGRNKMTEYTLSQWLLFFYIYCFLGWVWESAYVSVCERKLVNRGFLK